MLFLLPWKKTGICDIYSIFQLSGIILPVKQFGIHSLAFPENNQGFAEWAGRFAWRPRIAVGEEHGGHWTEKTDIIRFIFCARDRKLKWTALESVRWKGFGTRPEGREW